MRRSGIPVLLFVLCVGCNDAEQRRQVERDQQAAAVSNNLRNPGQAMHNQQNIDAAAGDSTSENSAAPAQAEADRTVDHDSPVNDSGPLAK